MPALSVIVPVYNVEETLSQCLDSLIHQTLQDIEIILVNDGSTDSSEQICRAYAEKDSRIKYFTKTNGGLSDARNYGIHHATADIIGFVDSDDYVDPDMFECLLRMMTHHHAQIAVGGVKMTTREGTVYRTRALDKECVLNRKEAMAELLYSKRILNAVWNKIFKKAFFENLLFPKGKLYEDEYVTYKLFHMAERVAVTNQTFYYYRQNPKSITHREFSERELDRVYASIEKLGFVRDSYPDLTYLAEQYLVYDCMMSLSKMKKYDRRYDDIIRSNLKKYGHVFLKSDHSLSSKLYVGLGMISPSLAVSANKLIRR